MMMATVTITEDYLLAKPNKELWIGLSLAILSSIFIGSSFILKKISLQKLGRSGRRRAGAGGFGYLKSWLWWAGLIAMGAGEGFNFLAYAFAPAALVTPLGALSVLITAILASYFLKEALNVLAKLGCALCLLGSTVVVIHAPQEDHIGTVERLISSMLGPVFLWYVAIVLGVVAVLLFYYSPRYGSRNVLVHLTVCSLIGAFSVLCCKVLGLIVKEGGNFFLSPLLYLTLLALVVCVAVQMVYLNKALDIFATTIVTPIYYVLFTCSVLLASAILFKEWEGLGIRDVLGLLAGFSTTVIGVMLLHVFREVDLSKQKLGVLLSSTPTMHQYHSYYASNDGTCANCVNTNGGIAPGNDIASQTSSPGTGVISSSSSTMSEECLTVLSGRLPASSCLASQFGSQKEGGGSRDPLLMEESVHN